MCEHLRMPDGSVAIVCGVRRGRPAPCAYCSQPSSLLCDGPTWRPGHATCDRPLCDPCPAERGFLQGPSGRRERPGRAAAAF